jgi:hypothetical protein
VYTGFVLLLDRVLDNDLLIPSVKYLLAKLLVLISLLVVTNIYRYSYLVCCGVITCMSGLVVQNEMMAYSPHVLCLFIIGVTR